MLPLSSQSLLKQSWFLAFHTRYMWFFGLLMTIPTAVILYLLTQTIINTYTPLLLIISLIICYCSIIFGKIGIIKTIEATEKNHTFSPRPILSNTPLRLLFHALTLDTTLFLCLLILFGTLFFPTFLFITQHDFATARPIFSFGLGIFIIFSIVISLIRQYSYCYLTLSQLPPYNSLKLGYSLFLHYPQESIRVGSILIIIRLFAFTLITFLYWHILIAGYNSFATAFSTLLLIAFCNIFIQIAWVIFFKHIASPTKKDRTEKESSFMEDDMVIGLDRA